MVSFKGIHIQIGFSQQNLSLIFSLVYVCVLHMLHAVPLSHYVPSSDAPISFCIWSATFSSPHQTSSLMVTENKWYMTENNMHSCLGHYVCCKCSFIIKPSISEEYYE